jgi:hypothetical protein
MSAVGTRTMLHPQITGQAAALPPLAVSRRDGHQSVGTRRATASQRRQPARERLWLTSRASD